ncbi:MAG TPA: hypothetical protein VGH90_03240 [Chthoniobacteraceae bacterium]|jgi:amino acid transporter
MSGSPNYNFVLFWFIAITGGGILLGGFLCVYAFRSLRRAKNPAEARIGLPEGCLIALLVVGFLIFMGGVAFAGCGILIGSAGSGTSHLESHPVTPATPVKPANP